VGGKLGDKAGLQKALKAANFQSVRGPFRYNANHFSIQGWHLQEVVRGADGKPALKTVAKIFDEHKDRYQKDCPMK
jgi:branched-chain amino acid transport system substrate-binding protein